MMMMIIINIIMSSSQQKGHNISMTHVHIPKSNFSQRYMKLKYKKSFWLKTAACFRSYLLFRVLFLVFIHSLAYLEIPAQRTLNLTASVNEFSCLEILTPWQNH